MFIIKAQFDLLSTEILEALTNTSTCCRCSCNYTLNILVSFVLENNFDSDYASLCCYRTNWRFFNMNRDL